MTIVTWPVTPPRLPAPLAPVIVEGTALASLVFFRNLRLRPSAWGPCGAAFDQANVRVYASAPGRIALVWFAAAFVPGVPGRLLDALPGPYRHRELSIAHRGGAHALAGDGIDVRVSVGGGARCDPALSALLCAERHGVAGSVALTVERWLTAIEPAAIVSSRFEPLATLGLEPLGPPLAAHLLRTGPWLMTPRLHLRRQWP